MATSRRTADRQLWIDGQAKYCQHDIEKIENSGGDVIAEICRRCQARVAEYGDCDGCRKVAVRLTAFLVTGPPRRFCTMDCRQHTLQAEKEAREARRRVAVKP